MVTLAAGDLGNSNLEGGASLHIGNYLCDSAVRIREASACRWGEARAVEIAGHSAALQTVLERLKKFASFTEPILITGESGTGKEGLAQACYVLGMRREKPFLAVNCPQLHDSNMTVSELFGHKKRKLYGRGS